MACKGCWNTQFWSPKGGDEIEVSDVLRQLDEMTDIEGITLLGGEPLQQATATLALIEGCKERELSVFLYTGYEPSEFDDTMQACFDSSDIVVTGRYDQTKRNTNLQWRGSENQKVHFVSERYNKYLIEDGNYIEIHMDENGTIDTFGYCENDFRDAIIGLVG